MEGMIPLGDPVAGGGAPAAERPRSPARRRLSVPRLLQAGLGIPGVILAAMAIAGMPLLAVRTQTGIAFAPWRIVDAAAKWLGGLLDGSSFRFLIGLTEWSFLDLGPRFLLMSFAYTAIPGAIGLGLGVFLGVASRRRRRGPLDRLVDFALATPDFLLVLALQALAVWLAMAGALRIPIVANPNGLSLLPLLVLTLYPFCLAWRAAASESRKASRSDHVAYARSKGLSERSVLWRHVGAGIFPRMVAELPGIVTYLQGSLFVVEFLFSIPGMARFLFNTAFAGPRNYYLRANYQYGLVVMALLGSILSCTLVYGLLRAALALARKALVRE